MHGKLGQDPRVHVDVGPGLKSGPIHFTLNTMLGLEEEAMNFLTWVCGNCNQTGLIWKAWQVMCV